MFWARSDSAVNLGEMIQAAPGVMASCVKCGSPLVPRCGQIKVWHFAHSNWGNRRLSADCEPWSEPEGKWHLAWKMRVPQNMREYVIKRMFIDQAGKESLGIHRADILNSRGTVIELQHSRISLKDIREREVFYNNMIWIWDAVDWRPNFYHPDRKNFSSPIRDYEGNCVFAWKNPRKALWDCTKPVFLHFGGQSIFRAFKFQRFKPYLVTGEFVDFGTFLKLFFV